MQLHIFFYIINIICLLYLKYQMDPRFVRSQVMIDFSVVYSDTACTVRSRCLKVIDTWVTVCIQLAFHLSFPDNLSYRPSQNLANPLQFPRSFPTSYFERLTFLGEI